MSSLLSYLNILCFHISYLTKWHRHPPGPLWYGPNLFFQPLSSAMTSSKTLMLYLHQMPISQTFKSFLESYCSTCLECLLYPHNNLLQSFSIKIPMECLHHARHYVRCEGEKWWHHSWHPHFNLHISSKVNSCDNLSDPHNHNWYPTILSAHVILITSLLYCNSLKFLLVSSLIVYFWY